jgi:hypothetical protein
MVKKLVAVTALSKKSLLCVVDDKSGLGGPLLGGIHGILCCPGCEPSAGLSLRLLCLSFAKTLSTVETQ